MKSIDALEKVLEANPRIRTVRFFEFSQKTKLQDRAPDLSGADRTRVARAIDRKAKESIRFWEALLKCMAEEHASSRTLLHEALYHQPNRDYVFVDRGGIRAAIVALENKQFALNSKVLLNDGSSLHIPLLDFKLSATAGHHQLVEDCIAVMGLRGFVIDSGRSYHFMGLDLMGESQLLDILARFALLHPISDQAWAAHQLIERSASLRISARGGIEPSVIRTVD